MKKHSFQDTQDFVTAGGDYSNKAFIAEVGNLSGNLKILPGIRRLGNFSGKCDIVQCSPSFSAQQVKEVLKPVKAVAGMFIMSALKRFQAVISGITGGKSYRLPPKKENTELWDIVGKKVEH